MQNIFSSMNVFEIFCVILNSEIFISGDRGCDHQNQKRPLHCVTLTNVEERQRKTSKFHFPMQF